jgi:diguanylate cyclase (GGDEF)-like protein/PAS domain S-box-containing protein
MAPSLRLRAPTRPIAVRSTIVSRLAHIWVTVRRALPVGQTLPDEAWAGRHKAMLWIVWAHVLFLPVFCLIRGFGVATSIGWVMPIALAGSAAMLNAAGRRARSVAVVLALLTASAVLVGAWGGQIEAHFHFFVMIAVLALYEDWLPFGLAIAYVVAEHGALGAVAPHAVYNHGGNPWVWALIHGLFVLGAVAASVVTWRLNEDMRARLGEAHHRARETSERFRLAFESGVSGMALLTPDGRYTKVNRALCKMIGYTEQELLGRTFQSVTHPDDLVADVDQQRALLAGAVDVYETEKRYLHRDGHEVWAQIGVTAVRDEDGKVSYFISQTHDVTTRRRVVDELAHRALHDPLTGLPNRALFLDRLRHALVRLRRHSSEVAVLFVDLDRFKLVNDGMGHGAGDAILVEAAQRLSDVARAEDTVARFGGDEFTILCENANGEVARHVARRVLDACARSFAHEGREFHLSASVGIRVNDLASASPDALLRDADIALYAAKEHGRARFEVFDPGSRMAGVDVLATEQALRLALRHGELCLHYQPEVDLTTQRIVAVEALVRWQHPERGLLPPSEFIPAAEETGLIVPMGEWVLGEACSQLATWRRAGIVEDQVRVAVNVSARQLSRPELPERVRAALAAADLDPAALCLEITESVVIEDAEVALANLTAIKEQGVCVALDDFGVGFSSLRQIRELPPVDVIKVDRSFTAGLGRNNSDGAVVTAVLSLARSLSLTAVAEGVETAEQLDLLRGLGCAVGQGFYFAPPLPADEIAHLLAGGTVALHTAGHDTEPAAA